MKYFIKPQRPTDGKTVNLAFFKKISFYSVFTTVSTIKKWLQ